MVDVHGLTIEKGLVHRKSYTVPLLECNGKHYFLDALHVDEIELDVEAQPRAYSQEAGEKIAASCKQKVLMQPILCRWDPKSKKALVTEGQHRLRAFKDILHWDQIPAIVYVDMDQRTALQCGIEANAEDRARSLTGGEIAKKAYAILAVSRETIAKEMGKSIDQVTEREIFDLQGWRTRSQEKKYLLGELTHLLMERKDAKIVGYVTDISTHDLPITVKNLDFFLGRLCFLRALNQGDENLRLDQLENVVRVTNMIADDILIGKWDPQASESPDHMHARNICRRHPFEALGYFIGKILDKHGGQDISLGAAWSKTDGIDWKGVEKDLADLLLCDVWDEPRTYTCRSIEELIDIISKRCAL